MQRVDVADHPPEQLAAPVGRELGRRERLDPRVEAGADPAERPQREVVRGESVQVAQSGRARPKKRTATIVVRQREDRRLLGGA